TTAKPAPKISASMPPSEGRERRRTKLMRCLLERTYVECFLAVAGMAVAETLETRFERAREAVAAVDDLVDVFAERVHVALLDVRRHVSARAEQRLVVGKLERGQHRRARLEVRLERAQRRRARRLVRRRGARLPDGADQPAQ